MLVLTRIVSIAFIFNQIPIYLAGKSKSLPVSSACAGLSDGLYPDPKSCRKFIHCHQNGQAAHKKCPSNLLFDPYLKVCNWARRVRCRVQKPVVPSTPRRFTSTELNGTIVRLTWAPPSRTSFSKPLLRYVIGYQRQHTGPSIQSQVIVQPSVRSYTLSGLLPGSNYLIEIQAVNNAGYGEKATLKVNTPLEVPSTPRRFTSTELNGTIVRLTWAPPSRTSFSKPLLRYVIGYQRQHTGPSIQSQVIVQPSVRSYTLSGLLPGSNYLIEIQAVNNAGYGEKATLKVNTPLEVPQEPFNLTAKALGPTAISLRWKDPKLSNDHILSYTVTYGVAGLTMGQHSFRLHGYANTAVLSNLLPGMEYEMKVQALSFGGFGKPAVVKVVTPPGDFCPPGHYSESGKKPCCKCTHGRYQSRTGKTRCIKCPRGTITLKEGATSMKDCVKVTTD